MKDIICYLRFLSLVLCLPFVACSEDDEKTTPVFPELQKMECIVGETAKIEFEANSNWKLTSSALWCQFLVGEENSYSCSGAAGKQSVTIQVFDDASELEKKYKAEITLWMNGTQQVIYEITRSTIGYQVILTDKAGNPYSEENPCVVPYNKSFDIKVKANFDWKLVSWPEWMTCMPTADVAFQCTYPISPQMNIDYIKNPLIGYFTFVNEEGKEVAKVPVQYDGIPEREIAFSLKQAWGWKFSADGKTYTGSNSSTTGEEYTAPLEFTVTAKNDAYKIVLLNAHDDYTYSHVSTPNWYQLGDDQKGSLKLSTEKNTGEQRKGCVMIFPKAIYDEIGDANFDDKVLPGGFMEKQYEKYMAVEFEQQGKGGFKVIDQAESKVLPVTSLLDEGFTEEDLQGMYNTKEVYRLTLNGAYESLAVAASGYSKTYCMLNTDFGTGSSGWDGTEVENTWSGANFNIYGIPAGAKGEMIITVTDENGFIHSVLIVQQGNVVRTAKTKVRK